MNEITEEDCKIDVGRIDLIPDKREPKGSGELGDKRSLSAAGIGADDCRRLIQIGPNALD